jgi:hypothetical protein
MNLRIQGCLNLFGFDIDGTNVTQDASTLAGCIISQLSVMVIEFRKGGYEAISG